MSVALCTITGGITRLIGGDISTSQFTNREVVFVPNVVTGTLIPIDGNLSRLDPVVAQLDSNGLLSHNGTPGVQLLANDPANPYQVALQWTVRPAASWPLGNTSFKPWTFIAPNVGESVTLESLARVPRLIYQGYVYGPPGPSVDQVVYNGSTGNIEFSVKGNTVGVLALSVLLTAISAGAPGALDTLKELADALGDDANFATTVTNALSSKLNLVQAAKNPDLLVTGAIAVDGNDLTTSAAVVWPDGSPGTFTVTSRDVNGAVLAYNITYGSPVTKTFTQPTITRNANGAATNIPAIVVS